MASVRIPQFWYNANAALPEIHEMLVDPVSGEAVAADALEELFAPDLVAQEFDTTSVRLPIPEDVLRRYGAWRPTPLLRARFLEQALDTRCRIFYKYEGSSPIGSHKANSGVAQAYYSRRGGRKRVFAETGAGQWGSAISMGSAFNDLQCEVFMVGNSYDSKPARRVLMETFGSTVHRSPSPLTRSGRREGGGADNSPGSLGLAIAEAIEAARADRQAAYALGSAFGFVCLHQTVIGQELKDQLADAGVTPDLLISCIGGGSSFAGLVFPFLEDVARGTGPDLVAVESNAVPKVTQGRFAYDHGDSAGLTPLIKMYTLGHQFAPPSIHSGGLRYHGLASQVSKLINLGLARGEAVPQLEVFEAAVLFARSEGLIPAPEAAHSIASACRYAREHRNEEKTIVFCLTGHGFFDLASYEKYNSGEMADSDSPYADIAKSLSLLPPSAQVTTAGPATRTRPVRQPVAAGRFGADDPVPASTTFGAWQDRHFGAPAASEPAPTAAPPAVPSSAPRPAGRPGAGSAPSAHTRRGPEPGTVDLSALAVVTERVIRDAGDAARLIIGSTTVMTPSAISEARARRLEIVRLESSPR